MASGRGDRSETQERSVVPGQQRRSPRVGSQMSSREIARAAVEGRRVTFKYFAGNGDHSVRGYVVGSDDFHWKVVVLSPDAQIELALVHKGLAPLTVFGLEPTLGAEPEEYREAVQKIGQRYWDFCRESHLISKPARTTEQ